MRLCALEEMPGEGGVGRECVPIALGSVVFGNRGNRGNHARECPLVPARLVGTSSPVVRGDTGSIIEHVLRSGLPRGADTARPTASARAPS